MYISFCLSQWFYFVFVFIRIIIADTKVQRESAKYVHINASIYIYNLHDKHKLKSSSEVANFIDKFDR